MRRGMGVRLQVKLISLVVVFVEEDDGLGSEVVDSDD